MKYGYYDGYGKSQCVDKNGNSQLTDSVNSNFYGKGNDNDETVKAKKQIDQKTINRLQAMSMSDDDDDYGKSFQ